MNKIPGSWEWPNDIPQQNHQPATGAQEDQTSTKYSYSSSNSRPKSNPKPKKEKYWKPRTCRICLETVQPTFHAPTENIPGILQPGPRVSYDSEGGRLIRPCKCKGSAKYVHEQCLQQWRHADPSYGARNFYHCPTCGFKYRLSRLGLGNIIDGVASQVVLTSFIFLITIFLLGFIADPIIAAVLDPYGALWRFFGWYSPPIVVGEDDGSWLEHFTKGTASLGLMSFAKVIISQPFSYWYRTSGGRGRRGNTGQDRLSNTAWLMIIIGAVMFIFAVWKVVRQWSKRVLSKASERVLDVQGEDEGDDDD